MQEILKNMTSRAWVIIFSSNTAWDEIVAEKVLADIIRKQYIYPWIVVAVASAFLFNLIYASDRVFETSILNAIITALSLFGGYFASNLICFAYLKRTNPDLASKTSCETLIAYSYTIIILIEIVTIMIPSLFFLRILSIFIAYVLWEGCRAIWMLKEEDRGNIVLVFSVVIIFIPIIITKIIHWMLPNV